MVVISKHVMRSQPESLRERLPQLLNEAVAAVDLPQHRYVSNHLGVDEGGQCLSVAGAECIGCRSTCGCVGMLSRYIRAHTPKAASRTGRSQGVRVRRDSGTRKVFLIAA